MVLAESFSVDDSETTPVVPGPNRKNTLLASGSALLYIVVLGMVLSYSAPATVDMKKPGSRFRSVTADEITWIASMPMISGIFGNILSGYVTNKLGRKTVLMFTSTSYLISWLIIAYATEISVIYTGRFISGFCAGMCAVAVPAYIVEIAPTDIRGLLTSGFQVAFSTGVLIIMSLGTVLRWSSLAIAGAAVVACAATLMVFMPESPPWLVRKSRNAEALYSLKFLNGKNYDSKGQLQEMIALLASKEESFKLKELLEPLFYKPAALGLALMLLQQFAGINVIMSYTVEIFDEVGSSVHPNLASLIVSVVQVCSTISCSLLMDKTGRRVLYFASGCMMTCAVVSLGAYAYVSSKYGINLQHYGWIPLLCIIFYIIAYALGIGPIPFVVIPEVSPIRSRSTIMAITNVSMSLFGFVATKMFHDMRTLLGLYGTFWTFGFFSLSSIVFGFFCLPETKGLTLQAIQSSFSSSKTSERF